LYDKLKEIPYLGLKVLFLFAECFKNEEKIAKEPFLGITFSLISGKIKG
jgi:hypothetical protein